MIPFCKYNEEKCKFNKLIFLTEVCCDYVLRLHVYEGLSVFINGLLLMRDAARAKYKGFSAFKEEAKLGS